MTDAVLEVRSLSIAFPDPERGKLARKSSSRQVWAVDNVDIEVRKGEILGIVGESGSGKSTLCKAIAGLQPVTEGTILYQGRQLPRPRSTVDRRAIQMVFQDPYTSLNPRLRIGSVLEEAVRIGGADRRTATESAAALLSSVGLPESMLKARPARLSGGQRQRVAIARALAVNPRVLLADEVTSSLDVSIQATIVELLSTLATERHLSLVFVTHNLQVVKALCQNVVVMHAGRVVEVASISDIFSSPQHPYTKSLLAAVPRLHTPGPLSGGASVDWEPSAVSKSAPERNECHFRIGCPLAHTRCAQVWPLLIPRRNGHSVACHAVEYHDQGRQCPAYDLGPTVNLEVNLDD